MSNLTINPNADETTAGNAAYKANLEKFMIEAKAKESLPLAILGGLVASIVAGIIWALISYATRMQIGFMAIGVGFLVGYAVNFFGKGFGNSFGVIGALFSLFGCLFGNLLAVIISAAFTEGVPVTAILLAFITSPSVVLEIFAETFSPIDLLFYGIAIYEGYKFSMRHLSDEEFASLQSPTDAPTENKL